ncbi:hypothetical protein Leryth_026744 [Lithospermum erythrorhizon]|nr:hypothetical protein Leryth_026744 [Lithospermum erythrorhizon]
MACPSSVEDLTCGESVVHVAVRDRCRGSFEVIFGWLIRFNTSKILQWKDREGNSALHIAAITNHSQVVSLLVKQIRVNDRNCEGLTALDLAIKFPGNESERIKKILKRKGALPAGSLAKDLSVAEFLRFPRKVLMETLAGFDIYMDLGLSGDMRNALLVVAVLIATATYQSMLQPPGGYMQIDSTDGSINRTVFKLAMPEKYSYPFMWLNTLAFASSVRMISFLKWLVQHHSACITCVSDFELFMDIICCISKLD